MSLSILRGTRRGERKPSEALNLIELTQPRDPLGAISTSLSSKSSGYRVMYFYCGGHEINMYDKVLDREAPRASGYSVDNSKGDGCHLAYCKEL